MAGRLLKFKKNPRYTHNRSEGLTHRGAERQERLMKGPQKKRVKVGLPPANAAG